MPKKLSLEFEDIDGNAFALLAYFERTAKKAGWLKEEIDTIKKKAMSGDYNHLLQVLISV